MLAILELAGQMRVNKWLLAIIAGAAAGVAGYDWLNINQQLAEVQSEYVRASAGIGLQIAALSGVLALVGALVRPGSRTP